MPSIMKDQHKPQGTNPAVAAADTTAFARPAWASRPFSLTDSSPQITTAELLRPVFARGIPRPFSVSDSFPQITTGELLRPGFGKSSAA